MFTAGGCWIWYSKLQESAGTHSRWTALDGETFPPCIHMVLLLLLKLQATRGNGTFMLLKTRLYIVLFFPPLFALCHKVVLWWFDICIMNWISFLDARGLCSLHLKIIDHNWYHPNGWKHSTFACFLSWNSDTSNFLSFLVDLVGRSINYLGPCSRLSQNQSNRRGRGNYHYIFLYFIEWIVFISQTYVKTTIFIPNLILVFTGLIYYDAWIFPDFVSHLFSDNSLLFLVYTTEFLKETHLNIINR